MGVGMGWGAGDRVARVATVMEAHRIGRIGQSSGVRWFTCAMTVQLRRVTTGGCNRAAESDWVRRTCQGMIGGFREMWKYWPVRHLRRGRFGPTRAGHTIRRSNRPNRQPNDRVY